MPGEGFQPRFISSQELGTFGLPSQTDLPTVMVLVEAASKLIDEHCGRTDGDGNGSLVYSTYTERILLPSPQRNIFRVSFKPLKALSAAVQANLIAVEAASGSGASNNYYTGFAANTVTNYIGMLTPLLSCSGRYAYSRRDSAKMLPDFSLGVNPMALAGIFGGPPTWMNIDVAGIEFATDTGELWIPVGVFGYQYQEVIVQYNSGFDPTNMPRSIKHACAGTIKNYIAQGGGITNLKSLSASKVLATFGDFLIDKSIDRFLQNYKTVIAF